MGNLLVPCVVKVIGGTTRFCGLVKLSEFCFFETSQCTADLDYMVETLMVALKLAHAFISCAVLTPPLIPAVTFITA